MGETERRECACDVGRCVFPVHSWHVPPLYTTLPPHAPTGALPAPFTPPAPSGPTPINAGLLPSPRRTPPARRPVLCTAARQAAAGGSSAHSAAHWAAAAACCRRRTATFAALWQADPPFAPATITASQALLPQLLAFTNRAPLPRATQVAMCTCSMHIYTCVRCASEHQQQQRRWQ